MAANGAPHVARIWFVIDGEDLVFNTGSGTGKGERNGTADELLIRLHPTKITAAFDVAS